jgi:hypothetical protein
VVSGFPWNKVNLPDQRSGLPGKEFGFFNIASLDPNQRLGLAGSEPVKPFCSNKTARRSRFMKIRLDFEESDSSKALFSVAVDGEICGELSMPLGKAAIIAEIIKTGAEKEDHELEISGDIPTTQDWVLWHKRSGIERRETNERRSGVERRHAKNRRNDKG